MYCKGVEDFRDFRDLLRVSSEGLALETFANCRESPHCAKHQVPERFMPIIKRINLVVIDCVIVAV